jgi:hypothetical protein
MSDPTIDAVIRKNPNQWVAPHAGAPTSALLILVYVIILLLLYKYY